MAALGEHFDMHGGGLDLVFPHHQNEIAQSEGVTGKKFVNTWIHVGFVQIDHQKMSKSLGNFFTLRDVLAKYPAEVLRYFLIASHYRSPIHYSQENLQAAQAAIQRLYISLRGLEGKDLELENVNFSAMQNEYQTKFNVAMDDDFNTPNALAVLFEVAREINRFRVVDPQKAFSLAKFLKQQAGVLGILQLDPNKFWKVGLKEGELEKIEELVAARNQARAVKNWVEADKIRDVLLNLGVFINDNPRGTDWYRH